jgi:hypothetical protein
VDHRVRVFDTSGQLLSLEDVRTTDTGTFEITLPDKVRDFRVVITGKSRQLVTIPSDGEGPDEDQDVQGDWSADVRGYDPDEDLVYVNAITTLIAAYRDTHPNASLAEATELIKIALTIPDDVDHRTGIDNSPGSEFEHDRFLGFVLEQGGLPQALQTLRQAIDAGVLFDPQPLTAEDQTSVARSANQGVTRAGEGPISFSTFTAASTGAFLLDKMAGAVVGQLASIGFSYLLDSIGLGGLLNRNNISGQLQEINNRLSQIATQLTALQDSIAQLQNTVITNAFNQSITRTNADTRQIATGNSTLQDFVNGAIGTLVLTPDQLQRRATVLRLGSTDVRTALGNVQDQVLGTNTVGGGILQEFTKVIRPDLNLLTRTTTDPVTNLFDSMMAHQVRALNTVLEALHAEVPPTSAGALDTFHAATRSFKEQMQLLVALNGGVDTLPFLRSRPDGPVDSSLLDFFNAYNLVNRDATGSVVARPSMVSHADLVIETDQGSRTLPDGTQRTEGFIWTAQAYGPVTLSGDTRPESFTGTTTVSVLSNLQLGTYKGFDLPTVAELRHLVQQHGMVDKLNKLGFKNLKGGESGFWTRDTQVLEEVAGRCLILPSCVRTARIRSYSYMDLATGEVKKDYNGFFLRVNDNDRGEVRFGNPINKRYVLGVKRRVLPSPLPQDMNVSPVFSIPSGNNFFRDLGTFPIAIQYQARLNIGVPGSPFFHDVTDLVLWSTSVDNGSVSTQSAYISNAPGSAGLLTIRTRPPAVIMVTATLGVAPTTVTTALGNQPPPFLQKTTFLNTSSSAVERTLPVNTLAISPRTCLLTKLGDTINFQVIGQRDVPKDFPENLTGANITTWSSSAPEQAPIVTSGASKGTLTLRAFPPGGEITVTATYDNPNGTRVRATALCQASVPGQ